MIDSFLGLTLYNTNNRSELLFERKTLLEVIHIVRTHKKGGGGLAKTCMVAFEEGRGLGLRGQIRKHKKITCTLSSLINT